MKAEIISWIAYKFYSINKPNTNIYLHSFTTYRGVDSLLALLIFILNDDSQNKLLHLDDTCSPDCCRTQGIETVNLI